MRCAPPSAANPLMLAPASVEPRASCTEGFNRRAPGTRAARSARRPALSCRCSSTSSMPRTCSPSRLSFSRHGSSQSPSSGSALAHCRSPVGPASLRAVRAAAMIICRADSDSMSEPGRPAASDQRFRAASDVPWSSVCALTRIAPRIGHRLAFKVAESIPKRASCLPIGSIDPAPASRIDIRLQSRRRSDAGIHFRIVRQQPVVGRRRDGGRRVCRRSTASECQWRKPRSRGSTTRTPAVDIARTPVSLTPATLAPVIQSVQ